jgi:quercetin 2,3-dioxygenase
MRFISSGIICIVAIVVYYRSQILLNLSNLIHQNITSPLNMSATKPQNDFVGLPLIPPEDPSLLASEDAAVPRGIQKVFEATEKSEGVGAKVRRSIGVPQLRNFTPFLMCDHFSIGENAGFPDHPHRHFETVTYLLSGGVDHEDFAGHKGTIGPGDLQFMTAGRGIVHAEMPSKSADGQPNVGMQLWVDLPKQLKWCEPRYRDLRASEIPIDTSKDGKVIIKVIAGQTHNGIISQQNLSYTPIWYLDITVKPGGKLVQPLPRRWNALAYLLEGSINFNTGKELKKVDQYHMTVFEQSGDRVIAQVPEEAEHDARLILIAGLPLTQPIVQYGPFVATSAEEVYQALSDYQTSSNGFERAKNWQSEIGQRMAF